MFEARLEKASILKKIIEAIANLVTECNFDCTASGISLQAMDSAHVSLVAMLLRADGFEHYRCDRHISLGLNLASLSKILKCAGNDDVVTIRAQDGESDIVTFIFEYKNKVTEFGLKLMAIDSEKLGIPETSYAASVKMPAPEFQRIVSSMAALGDSTVGFSAKVRARLWMKAPGKPFSFAFAGCILRRLTIIFSSEVTISVTKDGVKFGVSGDTGAGTTTIKRSSSADAEDEDTTVELEGDDVTLTFALRYLGFFTKATPLAQAVSLQMSAEVPLVVEYKINSGDGKNEDKKKDRRGYIRYYLAPKIEEE